MWEVYGFDTFANERYRILPEWQFEEEARARVAVRTTLEKILKEQPTEEAGDPDEEGSVQDYVILVHPDGTEEVFNTNHLKV